MIAGSLFSGIGGLEYGLHRSGLVSETAWMIEMDDFCCSVLEKNFPETMILNKKIEDVNPKYLPKIDILTAGFPCQPVSVAGARKGVNDERWLWDEVWRFIDVLRPRYFILENVPGLLTANKGKAFERVIKDISESRLYRFEWQIVSARSIGAPHLRKRFFGIGELADTIDSRQRTQKFEFEREGQENSQEWGRGQILESSRQSSSSELGNTEHNGSPTTEIRGGVGECPVQRGQGEEIQEEVDRKPEGEFTTSRQEAELWMGNTTYGFSGWMARLGIKNIWSSTPNTWRTPTTFDHKGENAYTHAASFLQGKNTRASGQPVQVALADQVAMEELKKDPDLFQRYAEHKILKRPNLPSQKDFVDYLRSVSSVKNLYKKVGSEISKSKIEHWFRYDDSGFSYPSIDHWYIIKPYLLPLKFDKEMTYTESYNWVNETAFPTAAARDHKDTYGTVLTGSKTGDRNTLPLNIFRKLRDQIKDFAMWEYNMPRSIEDYPDRVNKLKALGNAVVPQCAELVGRLILNSIGTDKLIFCDSIKEDHPQ